jgi:hypothetical protein
MLASDGVLLPPGAGARGGTGPHSQRGLADQASCVFLGVPEYAGRISRKLKRGVWYQWLYGFGARQESLLSMRTSHGELSHHKMLWLHAEHRHKSLHELCCWRCGRSAIWPGTGTVFLTSSAGRTPKPGRRYQRAASAPHSMSCGQHQGVPYQRLAPPPRCVAAQRDGQPSGSSARSPVGRACDASEIR